MIPDPEIESRVHSHAILSSDVTNGYHHAVVKTDTGHIIQKYKRTHPIMRHLVTISIPTYNRADSYLREAIRSALCQTYENIEVIVSDNCSSDNTGEVVKGFGDARIRYYRQEKNIGYNNNFNFCLEQARGEFFLLLSDDDVIDPDFVETCLNRCKSRSDFGMIHTGVRVIDVEGRTKYVVPNLGKGKSIPELVWCWFENGKAIYLCSTLFVTERLRRVGGFHSKHNLAQDMMAQFRLAAQFGWIDVEEVKASVRRHSGEITYAAKISLSCEEGLMLLDLICQLCPESGQEAVRREGMVYFSRRNYRLAMEVKQRWKRLCAYLTVYRIFGLGYPPPWSHLRSQFGGIWRRLTRAVSAATARR